VKAVAIFPRTREIRVIDHPEPKIESSTQVKLRILEVGVCGTDKELCSFDYGTPPEGSEYLVIGHESLGEVIEVGPDVSQFKVGDLAVVMVRRPCHHKNCVPCCAGRQDFCYTGDFTERGINKAHGFMTEFVVDEEKYMIRVPQEIRSIAVLTEPLTIAEKAVKQLWTVQERLPWEIRHSKVAHGKGYAHHAVVLGAGPVGLLGAMVLVKNEFKTCAYSREPITDLKASLIKAIGADYVSAATHSPEQLAKQVGNIDLVFEAAGASQVSFELLKVLGTNGAFIFTGIPAKKAPVPVDIDFIMRNVVLKNQDVFGSVNASHENFSDAVTDLTVFNKNWSNTVQALITKRYAIDTAELQDVLLGKVGGIKNTIKIS
jgi:glucose 1-dehydrogenase